MGLRICRKSETKPAFQGQKKKHPQRIRNPVSGNHTSFCIRSNLSRYWGTSFERLWNKEIRALYIALSLKRKSIIDSSGREDYNLRMRSIGKQVRRYLDSFWLLDQIKTGFRRLVHLHLQRRVKLSNCFYLISRPSELTLFRATL